MPRGNTDYRKHIQNRLVKPPAIVYKYVSFSVAETILKSRMFRFQSPLHFNDPFDCQWDLHWPAYTDEAKEYGASLLRSAVLDPKSWPPDAGQGHIDLSRDARNEILQLSEAEQEVHIKNLIHKYLFSKEDGLKTDSIFQDILERMRLFCVTENPLSVLMWSHYADNHKGFVFGFDSRVLEEEFQRPFEKVDYITDLPQLFDPSE